MPSSARTPSSKTAGRLLRAKRISQRIQLGSSEGRITRAPFGSRAERRPVRSTPGEASGMPRLGVTQPALPREAPEQSSPASSSTTSSATSSSAQAQAVPTTPPPMTATRIA